MTARLKEMYEKNFKKSLKDDLKIKNIMAVPRLEKITINMGVGEASQEKGKIEGAINDLKLISGQQPVVTKARKSVAGFKLREGSNVGVKVTLRRDRMYEFLDRLVNIALPRVRDFRGLSKNSFDGKGNFSLGIKEQIIFPEIDYDNIDTLRGMDITIVTSAKNDKEGFELLKKFNMPINN
tara:strand:- start:104 stop:646 length:543 start_codon:yes stop_codon:yes gene_type:complete